MMGHLNSTLRLFGASLLAFGVLLLTPSHAQAQSPVACPDLNNLDFLVADTTARTCVVTSAPPAPVDRGVSIANDLGLGALQFAVLDDSLPAFLDTPECTGAGCGGVITGDTVLCDAASGLGACAISGQYRHNNGTELSFTGDVANNSTTLQNVAFTYMVTRTVTLSGGDTADESVATRTITATLSAVASRDTTFTLVYTDTVDDGGVDYKQSTTITINAGETSGSTTFTVVDDADIESDETVIIDIQAVSGGDGAIEGADQQQTFTIADDDFLTVSLSGRGTVREGGGPVTVTATVTGSFTENMVVLLSFSGSATPSPAADNDFIDNAIILIPSFLTANSIEITTLDDDLIEPDETIIVEITGITGGNGATSSGLQRVTYTIEDNKSGPASIVSVSAPSDATYIPDQI